MNWFPSIPAVLLATLGLTLVTSGAIVPAAAAEPAAIESAKDQASPAATESAPAESTTKSESAGEGEKPAENAAAEELAPEVNPADEFALPEGGPDELLMFIQGTLYVPAMRASMNVTPELPREELVRGRRAAAAMVAAADRGLSGEFNESQEGRLFRFRLQGLELLRKNAQRERASWGKNLIDNPNPAIAFQGWMELANSTTGKWDKLSAEEQAAFQERILSDFPTAGNMCDLRVSVVNMVGRALSYEHPDAAISFLTAAQPIVAKCDDPKFAVQAEVYAGMIRRLQLPGNVMEVAGDTIEGEPFNVESYRGKVVLIDFWATWCGPCMRELPNVQEMYKAYHDRGFEVVGISLDESQEKTEKFLADREIPWVTLFTAKEGEIGWKHPVARQYGIEGIPTAILLDQAGKAVNINARGSELQKELARLIGPLEVASEAKSEAEPETTTGI